jgi:hypothetical protein
MMANISSTYICGTLVDFINTTSMHSAMLPLTGIAISTLLPAIGRRSLINP